MKKKGFTLIELLAVIVILAIIMVVAVPQILNVIEEADKNAYKESVELMTRAAKIQYQAHQITNDAPQLPVVYVYENNAQVSPSEELKFKGDKPFSGSITLNEERKTKVEELVSKNKKWCASKEYDGPVIVNKCGAIDDPVVEDKVPCELEVDSSNENILYVDSPDDLYGLAKSVNAGNSYSGKTIKLRNNLDFSEYTEKETCGITGYNPIGTQSVPFSGTFNGGGKTISNLTINKPGQNHVGIFGYNNGASIYGLTIKNITVTGSQHVGALIGYNSSSAGVHEIVVDGVNVSGVYNVGSITGGGHVFNSGYYPFYDVLIKNSTVSANNYVYAGAPTGSYRTIIDNVTVTASDSNPTGGMNYSGQAYVFNCKFNNNPSSSGDAKGASDLNFFESIGIDTWIAGDNDTSGYYFDYQSPTSKNIVVKSTALNPIPTNAENTFEKDSNDKYLIKNEDDWKKATAFVGTALSFKLDSDLSFSSKNFYMMGSSYHSFTGSFEGGAKTISDVEINAPFDNDVRRLAIFGYQTSGSVINGLNISNIKVVGGSYQSAGLVGESNGSTIREIAAENIYIEVGAGNAGCVIGNSHSTITNILLKSGQIKNYGSQYSGALLGNANMYSYGNISNLMVENAIADGTNMYPVIGATNNFDRYSNVKLNGDTLSPVPSDFTSDKIGNIQIRLKLQDQVINLIMYQAKAEYT